MSGKKKQKGQTSNGWGGARKGSGRKLKSTSSFPELYDRLAEKWGTDPVEAQFIVMDKTKDGMDPVSIKIFSEASRNLMNKRYANPTETFEDEDGNTVLPTSSEIGLELAMKLEELKKGLK